MKSPPKFHLLSLTIQAALMPFAVEESHYALAKARTTACCGAFSGTAGEQTRQKKA